MKLERTKNAFRIVKFGLISKIIAILFPFAVRTV